MGSKKNNSTGFRFIQIVLIFLLITTSVYAQSKSWRNITSFNDVRKFRVINDTLYAVTSGGLSGITESTLPGRKILNYDGLGTADIYDIIVDADLQKWVAGMGKLVKFNELNSKIYLFRDTDNNNLRINCLADDGNNLWAGTEIGLVLFDKITDGGQISDSYELFGNLNPSPDVYDIFIKDDSIYLATSSGVAIADKSKPTLLNSPLNWKTFSMIDFAAMGSDTVYSIAVFESNLYAATSRNFIAIDVDTEMMTVIPISSSIEYASLRLDYDTLFFYYNDSTGGGAGYIKNQILNQFEINGIDGYPLTGVNYKEQRWIADGEGGFYYSFSNDYVRYPFVNLPKNDVSDITIDFESVLHAGFKTGGFAVEREDTWNYFDNIASVTKMMTDSSGSVWTGTYGYGLWKYSNNGFYNYSNDNSTMIGNDDDLPRSLSFIVLNGLVTDAEYLYALCYRAINGYPVAIARMTDGILTDWDSLGITQGITNEFVTSLDVHDNLMAIGTEAVGLYYCDLGDDPFDHSGINVVNHTRESRFLISNTVRVLKFAPDGSLWAGTNFGLSWLDPGIDYYRDVNLPANISSDITALEFDMRGNLWIGTVDGLAYRDVTSGNITVYKTSNSNLVNNRINNIKINHKTGEIFVATDGGISVIPSFYGTPVSDIEQVIAFPNPFEITNGNEKLFFNYSQPAVVRIYTINGEMVREVSVNSGWDGKNQQNNAVASGVYLYVLTDTEGNVKRGKIFVVK